MIGMRSFLAPMAVLLCAETAWPQLRVSYGAITGTVQDARGGRVPSASVTARDPTRGIERTATTDPAGEYLLPVLPPGTYEMEFEAPGFAKLGVRPVEVRVGDTVVVDAPLAITAHKETLTVSTTSPLIEAQRVQQANAIETRDIESLPMNQRNYLNLALLAPGVVETKSLTDATDFRIPSTPASGLGFAGSNGRGNVFAVDGFGYNGSVGNVRPSVPQISVQEFQVNRNSYSAEYGGGFGGAINVVTRSGTNALHGSAFGYLRHRSLEARDAFAIGDPAFTRVQSGGSLGGPVRKNKTFFFAGFERLDRHESVFVPILRDAGILTRVTPSQDQLLSYLSGSGSSDLAQLSALLRGALTPASNPAVTPLFQSNSGSFPFAAGISRGAVRGDHQFSPRSSLMVRFTIAADVEQNIKFGAQTGLSRGSSSDQADREVAGEYLRVLSPRWITVTRFGYGYDRLALIPNDPIGPALDITGYGSFGRNPQFPSTQRDRILDAQQNVTGSLSRHTLNMGVQLYPVRNDVQPGTYLGGRFIFGEFLPLGAFIDTITGDSGFSTRLGQTLTAAGQAQLAGNLALPISSLQSFALGLPVAYVQGFGNTRAIGWQQRHSAFLEDSWKARPNLTITAGIRYQYDSNSQIPGASNVAPRFGFAWSANSNLVVRGGYGMFPSFTETEVNFSANALKRPDLAILFIPAAGVPVINPKTNLPLTSIDVFQTLLAAGILGRRTVQFDDLRPLGVVPGFRLPTTGGIADPWRDPYSHQASFEIEKSFGETQISVAYNFSRSLHLPRTRDLNLKQVGTRPDGWPVFGPVDPAIANNYVIEPAANAYYNAMVIQASRRFSRNWSFAAHYTWSKAIDETSDFNIEYTAQNQLDVRADRGLSSFNQAHRFVAYGLYRSPSTENKWLAGWSVAPIIQASSGRPFNVLTGFDNLGDGQATTHRPLGLGRNVGLGPDFVSVDARVERAFRFKPERPVELRLTFEVFNLFNRTNFQTVNNIVGATPLSALPAQLEGRRGNPAEPFSFTSAYERRQVQLGLQLAF
jgi:hypothetical protein